MKTFMFAVKTSTGTVTRSVAYLVEYHPWKKGHNPTFNNSSKLILAFKNRNASVVTQFANFINAEFNPLWANCCCVAVPSSNPQKLITPVHDLIKALVSLRPGLQNGSDALIRTHAIKKLANGGKRSKEVHLNSIRINRSCSINISGRDILLIDDVITTGNSLLACMDKLKDGGAKRVFLLTLAKTVR